MNKDRINPLLLARFEWPTMLLGALASLVLALSAGLLPVLCVGPLVQAIGAGQFVKTTPLLLLGGCLVLLASVAQYAQDVLFGLAGARAGWRLRAAGYRAALGANLAWSQNENSENNTHNNKHSGGRVARLGGDIQEVSTFIANDLGFLFGQACTVLVATVFLLRTHFLLTLILIAVVVPLTLLLSWLGRGIERNVATAQDAHQNASANMGEGLSQLEAVKALRLESRMRARFQPANNAQMHANEQRVLYSALHWPLAQVVVFVAVVVLLLVALAEIQARRFALPGLLTFLTLVGTLVGPLQILSRFAPRWFAVQGPAKSIYEALQQPPEHDAGLQVANKPRGEIVFETVALRYQNDAPFALNGLDCHFPAKRFTALVGASGSGKTSVSRVLLRLVSPTQGRVLLDGINIQDHTLGSLRGAIAYVPQHPFVLIGSVRENLGVQLEEAPNNEAPTDETLWHVLKQVGLDEEIRALPQQLETRLGERGAGLSGGQLQRLAIARALLVGASVIVLDEPTSALDAHNEATIKQSLAQLRGTHTLVVIAHRLSTIEHADQILVMDAGRIVEAGTHTQLSAQNGPYKRLLDAQQQP